MGSSETDDDSPDDEELSFEERLQQNYEGELTEEDVRRAKLVRLAVAGFVVLVVGVTLIATLSAFSSVELPGNNSSIAPPENQSSSIIIVGNATAVSYNETGGVAAMRLNETNVTIRGQMAWVDTVGRDFEQDRYNVSSDCYADVSREANEYVNTSVIDQPAFVVAYEDSNGTQVEFFTGEEGNSVSGILLARGYAAPTDDAGEQYKQVAVRAQENEEGIWACVSEDEEPTYDIEDA